MQCFRAFSLFAFAFLLAIVSATPAITATRVNSTDVDDQVVVSVGKRDTQELGAIVSQARAAANKFGGPGHTVDQFMMGVLNTLRSYNPHYNYVVCPGPRGNYQVTFDGRLSYDYTVYGLAYAEITDHLVMIGGSGVIERTRVIGNWHAAGNTLSAGKRFIHFGKPQ